MAGFNAAEEVDALDFDFNPYVDAKGVIPEPSTKQIQAFQRGIKEIAGDSLIERAKVAEAGGVTVSMLEKALSSDTEAEQAEKFDTLLTIVAAVCSDAVSKEMLLQLPFRLQQHFVGWLTGKLLSPEASTPATT